MRLAILILLAFAATLSAQVGLRSPVFVAKTRATVSPPAYVGEDQRWLVFNSSTTTTLTVSNGITAGNLLVMWVNWLSASQTLSNSITDSRGNTYSMHTNGVLSDQNLQLWSAPVTTTLQVGDTITLTWINHAFTTKNGAIFSVSGASSYDVGYRTNGIATAGSSENTTTAPAVGFGLQFFPNNLIDLASSDWDIIGAVQLNDAPYRFYYLKETMPSPGVQNPNTTFLVSSYMLLWGTFK